MNDQQANTLFEQSIALLQQGKTQDALKLLAKLDQAIPSNPGILFFTATGLSISGNKHKAIQTYERVLRLNPQFIEAYNNLALDLAYLGQHESAVSHFDKALAIHPDFAEGLINKGCSLNELGLTKKAIACFEQALKLRPNNSEALANLTISYIKLEAYEKARHVALHMLSLDKNDYKAYQNLGDISLKEEDPEGAIEFFNSALKIKPDDADAISGIGTAHLAANNLSAALKCFETTLRINPDHGLTYNNLGLLYQDARDFDKAIKFFSHPIQNQKRAKSREYNRALAYLHANNLESGWKDYLWRWSEIDVPITYLQTKNPQWDGQAVNNPVLIWHEQGIGDQILFGTLLAEAAAKAPDLLVRLDTRLLPLFQRSFPRIRFISPESPITDNDFKYHCPIGDLARLFRNKLNDFGHQPISYLKTDACRAQVLRDFIKIENPVIGLSWSTKGKKSKERNLPIGDVIASIQHTLPATFIDLQYVNTTEDRERIAKNQSVLIQRIDEVDNFNDIDSLAALISACDFVVTCSNSTAHIAGAIGKETYLLVPFSRGRHWYWSHIGENGQSLWYPSIKIIPQTIAGDWTEPINRLETCLKNRPKQG